MPTEISSFKYSSEPKAIKDPRVARGNTHSLARKVAQASMSNTNGFNFTGKATTKQSSSSSGPHQLPFPTYFYETTTFAGEGMDILKYCEEDPATSYVSMVDEETQADSFAARPVTPDYIPRKTGVDCATQIEDQTELFDFDREVLPLLNIIVDKTIEQALFECGAEAELLALHGAANEFRAKKAVELKWMKQREAAVANEINAKRTMVNEKTKEQQELTRVKKLVAGRFCFRQLLPTVVDGIFDSLLNTNEVWENPTVSVISKSTLPSITKEVVAQQLKKNTAEELINELIMNAKDKYDAVHYVPQPVKPRIVISFTLPASKVVDGSGDVKLGPFDITSEDTVLTLVEKVQQKLASLRIVTTVPIDAPMVVGYISAALQRTVAIDAILINFDMPSSLTVVV